MKQVKKINDDINFFRVFFKFFAIVRNNKYLEFNWIQIML